MEMFWKRGVRATTTRDLERVLGVSQSSLYNAFGSKDEIVRAAMTEYESLAETQLLAPLERSASGIPSLTGFFEDLGEWVSDERHRGCLLLNILAEDGGESDFIRERTASYLDRVRSALTAALERAAEAGEIAHPGLEAKAELLLGLALGISLSARGGVDASRVGIMVEASVAQIAGWSSFG